MKMTTQNDSARLPASSESKRIKAAAMCLLITIVSFLGYMVETVFVAMTDGYIDNRNMLLPFLLGYGLAMAGIYGAFGTPTAPRFFGIRLNCRRAAWGVLYYFGVVFLAVSAGEALMGIFVEACFDITWWDYSSIPLHVTKFTSVPTSLAFTALVMLFMHAFFERIYRACQRMNRTVLYVLALVFMVLLAADFMISGVQMFLTHDFVRYWRIEW